MLKVCRIGSSLVFGFVLTSSGVAHSQVATPSDMVGQWRSPGFTEKGNGKDTLVARTTILFQQDSTWLSYTKFWVRNQEQSYHTQLISGGAWRRNGDTLWMAEDHKWYGAVLESTAYTRDGEPVGYETVKIRPQPAPTAWKSYRATLRDQRLSVGQFEQNDTSAASEPFACGAGTAHPGYNYDRLLCPGVYDHRTASTP